MLKRALEIIGALSRNPAGMTAGELQRACKDYSKGQVQTTLKELAAIHCVLTRVEPHGRTGKVVYSPTVTLASYITRTAKQFLIQEVAQ